jgi:hypothetical protein
VLHARVRNFRGKTFVAVSDQSFELTDTAALAWTSADGRRTISEIAGIVRAEYDVDDATVIADISQLFETLGGAGLVEY